MKDKPFALVSISVDAEKQTLVDFLAKESMPWNHWWNGAEGKLIDTLSIQHYPTIFVLDPSGVIRFKEIRGEELEKAVNLLLDEAQGQTGQGGVSDHGELGRERRFLSTEVAEKHGNGSPRAHASHREISACIRKSTRFTKCRQLGRLNRPFRVFPRLPWTISSIANGS